MIMMNVLINAYAVAPNRGSEPGMGWNWVINIARYCNVFVITEGEWREEIEEAVKTLPQRGNIHFYWNPLSERVRRMCRNQGDWRFYFYYRGWQKKTLEIAREIVSKHKIDVIHQLNMIGFREPGLLWRIKGIPFVWGPIGGMDIVPINTYKGKSLKYRIAILIKNVISCIQRRYQPSVRQAVRRAASLCAATVRTKDFIRDYYHRNAILISETGIVSDGFGEQKSITQKDSFDVVWVGRFIYTKQLELALEVMSLLKDCKITLHIAGTGTDDEVKKYKSKSERLGISEMVVWHGGIPHKEVNKVMINGDLFLFTSISEATSTVIPEAISCNLPIVCFNLCGFGVLVKDRVGETIEITNYKQAAIEFAAKIRYLYQHRDILKKYSRACDDFKYELSWEWKAKKMAEVYEKGSTYTINTRFLRR